MEEWELGLIRGITPLISQNVLLQYKLMLELSIKSMYELIIIITIIMTTIMMMMVMDNDYNYEILIITIIMIKLIK